MNRGNPADLTRPHAWYGPVYVYAPIYVVAPPPPPIQPRDDVKDALAKIAGAVATAGLVKWATKNPKVAVGAGLAALLVLVVAG